ncbi:hypothetical protein SH601_09365 [Gracilibacillus sp. S3-1-1]|uniref:Uncharacterized protein n=1 Tax=Gracilibacillus pellucidus TaxID=3095368 RepID=A0ACC6M5E9_9BACI|nr:hypothetical protein [Gracilibacillus sp. S3-1-1]MDX8046198.1 hypothetical protein [Gracilibacillus sp. S3-1-1]
MSKKIDPKDQTPIVFIIFGPLMTIAYTLRLLDADNLWQHKLDIFILIGYALMFVAGLYLRKKQKKNMEDSE